MQGVAAGALVALGFLAVFAVVGLPLTYGVGAVADAVPWVGLATGAALALVGILTVAGVAIRLPSWLRVRVAVRRERRARAMLLFGVGYGAASLGCTLPIFLALVGASLGAGKVTTFLAYGLGMTLVLMALAIGGALARRGIARFLRSLLPHVHRLSGLLVAASGLYLAYYWARIRFGNDVTLADDPIVGLVSRYSGHLEAFARQHGTPFIAAAAAIVGLALIARVRKRRARSAATPREVIGS